ncbi:MAG: hypothetical protein ACPG4T_10920, partial [Nannocystaceae bacterium]
MCEIPRTCHSDSPALGVSSRGSRITEIYQTVPDPAFGSAVTRQQICTHNYRGSQRGGKPGHNSQIPGRAVVE